MLRGVSGGGFGGGERPPVNIQVNFPPGTGPNAIRQALEDMQKIQRIQNEINANGFQMGAVSGGSGGGAGVTHRPATAQPAGVTPASSAAWSAHVIEENRRVADSFRWLDAAAKSAHDSMLRAQMIRPAPGSAPGWAPGGGGTDNSPGGSRSRRDGLTTEEAELARYHLARMRREREYAAEKDRQRKEEERAREKGERAHQKEEAQRRQEEWQFRMGLRVTAGSVIGGIGGMVSGSAPVGFAAGALSATGIPGMIVGAGLSAVAANTTQGANRIHQFGGWLEEQTRERGFLRELNQNLLGAPGVLVAGASMLGRLNVGLPLNPFRSVRELGGLVDDVRDERRTGERLGVMQRQAQGESLIYNLRQHSEMQGFGFGISDPIQAAKARNEGRTRQLEERLDMGILSVPAHERLAALDELNELSREMVGIKQMELDKERGILDLRVQQRDAVVAEASARRSGLAMMNPGDLRRLDRDLANVSSGRGDIYSARRLMAANLGSVETQNIIDQYVQQHAPNAYGRLNQHIERVRASADRQVEKVAELAQAIGDVDEQGNAIGLIKDLLDIIKSRDAEMEGLRGDVAALKMSRGATSQLNFNPGAIGP